MRRITPLALLMLAACAGVRPEFAGPPSRGASVAQRQCAACHAVGPTGDSPRSGAPPFREIARRYNELALRTRLVELNGKGHWEMPPVTLQPSDVDSLAAYIASR